MILVEARATRWVADEPFPGLVEIVLTDSDGRVHRFIENARSSTTPTGSARTRAEAMLLAIDLSPWSIGDPEAIYTVERSSLMWGER